eukprot:15067549-Heterocapsa_arctica.AAC.1
MSTELVASMGQTADLKGPFTSLETPKGLAIDREGKCPLKRSVLPEAGHWATAARPGGYRHITLEEADAT